MAPPAAAAKTAKKAGKVTKPINGVIGKTGIMRLSRGRMFHKRGLWHIEKWKKTNEKKPEERKPKKATRIIKKTVKGDKNGGSRQVRVKRFPKFYPTEDRPKKLRTNAKSFSQHKHTLRPTITPGTVLILVAGRHAGKRVVFLKQLKSGLLLVTGPFKLNGCPLRRINQIYVIATSTKVDISKVTVPENINDAFFNRVKAVKKTKKAAEGEIFETKKETYKVNEERKSAQLNVDKQLIVAIKANAEKGLITSYLKSKFGLSNKQYPHTMKF
jgi:large subunit ribosomal protein L6e